MVLIINWGMLPYDMFMYTLFPLLQTWNILKKSNSLLQVIFKYELHDDQVLKRLNAVYFSNSKWYTRWITLIFRISTVKKIRNDSD